MPSPEFLITALIVVLIPGTGVIYTVSTGLIHGRRASLFAALGCTAGILPHLAASVLGLAAIMHTSALAYQALKYAGVGYLFYIAYSTWCDTSSFTLATQSSATTAGNHILKALLLNTLNPKLTIFFLAFLPQFIRPEAGTPIHQLLALSTVFMIMTFIIFVAYGALAHTFRKTVIESPRVQVWLRRGFAATFAGLGAHLATTEP